MDQKKKKGKIQGTFILPAFINEIYHKCAKNKENEQGNEHVVDGPDVVHLKQLTAEKQMAFEKQMAVGCLYSCMTLLHNLQAVVKPETVQN